MAKWVDAFSITLVVTYVLVLGLFLWAVVQYHKGGKK